MRLFDVTFLVYAHRGEMERHGEYRAAFEREISGDSSFGYSDLALSGFLRIVTHPRAFKTPTPLADATRFVEALRDRPNAVPIRPGPRHWPIFTGLCEAVQARGNLIPDAWFAALAIESGCEWLTSDGDYARFPGLRWAHPLATG